MLYALLITCTVSGQFCENVLSNTIATHYIISVTHTFTTATLVQWKDHAITKAGES